MVKRNEYKRRQAPPGVRVSGRAFGRDWRYPITSGYKCALDTPQPAAKGSAATRTSCLYVLDIARIIVGVDAFGVGREIHHIECR